MPLNNIKKTSIAFLMPGGGKLPAGGYKVVYEYANRFAKDGYDVSIVYPAFINNIGIVTAKKRFISFLRYFYYKLGYCSCSKWFKLHKSIKEQPVYCLNQKFVPKSDIYIATARPTSLYLSQYDIPQNRKFYFIQDFENWGVQDSEVIKTYKLGLQNIVISKWLEDILFQNGVKSIRIPNGFDFNYFKKTMAIESRNPFCISMLYNPRESKGCKYGISALIELKKIYPQLTANLFGACNRPTELPDWIEYYKQPDCMTHNRIYNDSAIYIAPSLSEGWGLTVGEAMICGAAVVCTDAAGFKEMITDSINGLICECKNTIDIVTKVKGLIENNAERTRLATNGNKSIRNFTWEKSYQTFRELINHSISHDDSYLLS